MSDFSFRVNNIDIKSNTIYQVTDKYDADAPEGLKKLGMSKMPQLGIAEIEPCIFHEKKGVWDTGFFEQSPCYTGKKDNEIKTLVNTLNTHIVKPYERNAGDGKLNHQRGNAEWDKFGVKLYTGRTFNTNEPQDLLDLYIAVLHNHVVRKEDSGQHFAMKAKYCLINKEEATTVKDERRLNKADAIGSYYSMLHTDREKLMYTLEYIGIISTHEIEDKVLTSIFMEYVEGGKNAHENVKRVNDAFSLSTSESGYDEICMHSTLSNLVKKGKIQKIRSEFYIDDTLLGGNIKEAVFRVVKTPELRSLVNSLTFDKKPAGRPAKAK